MKFLKYHEFNALFKKHFSDYRSVKYVSYFISQNYSGIKIPSWRQVFRWIKTNRWVIRRDQRLRQYYQKGRKRKLGVFGKLNKMYVKPFWSRPHKINDRSEFGHWEIDFVIGKQAGGHDNLLTLTERQTRYSVIHKVKNKNPWVTISVIKKVIEERNLPVKTITVDNGIEFKNLGLLGHWLKIDIYVCEPCASYQRGSNEHVNGLIRRTYKKGSDFTSISNKEICELEDNINQMPREMFGWKTSQELFDLAK